MSTVITTNPHDNGLDLVLGSDITGRRIGTVYYDTGLVMRIDGDDEDYLPANARQCAVILADMGHDLTAESVAEIAELSAQGI